MGSSTDYNPVRWVCQRIECEGWYTARGERLTCPIYRKCQASGGRGHQLEYLYPRKSAWTQSLAFETDPARTAAHDKRRDDIMRAFGWKTENRRAYFKRHPEKRRELTEKQAAKRRLDSLMHPKPPRANIPPPPCGGDCGDNCPYDGICAYPNWEDDWIAGYGKRRWSAIKADPEKLAHAREIHRRASSKYYYKNRFLRAGESLEEFETLWAKAGGTPEQFKALLAEEGERKSKRKV